MIQRRKPLRRSPIQRKPAKVRTFKKDIQIEREAAERRAERDERKRRELCRYETYKRAHGCCERCGRALVLLPSQARHVFEIMNCHEEPPRSKGTDPTDPANTVSLCCHCHQDRTDNKIAIRWKDPVKKAYGGPVFLLGSGKENDHHV
jgi:hypothetical protein